MAKTLRTLTSENRFMLEHLASAYTSALIIDLTTKEYEVVKTVKPLQYLQDSAEWPEDFRVLFKPSVCDEFISELMDFCDTKNVMQMLASADESRTVTFCSKIGNRKEFKIKWMIAGRDEGGKPTMAFLVSNVIDQEKQRQQEKLRQINDTIHVAGMGIWKIELFDGEHPRMIASAKMRELLGLIPDVYYTDEEIYDKWYSRICPEALDSVNKSVERMLSGKRDENTYKWNHPTRGVRYVRCGGSSYCVPNKGYVVQGYHYDVTEQVMAERERTTVINSLAKTYLCLYYIDMGTGTYTSYINIIPTVVKAVPDKGVANEGLHTFATKLCKPEFTNLIRSFTDMSTLDRRLRHKNIISTQFHGVDDIWCEASFVVCDRNDDGTIAHLILGIRDIDSQKRNEIKQLEILKANIDANKNKSEFLQNMTHEIRTPLNAMFGFAQLLSLPDGSFSDEEKADYFNYINNSFNMLSMLIDDVLDLADADHGNYRVVSETVNVNSICRTAMQMAEIRVQPTVNLYFTTELADDFTIKSDSRRIQQVLINYLTNACKHTMDGEIHLHCSTTENPGRLTFSVTDTGEGIPSDMAENIFERYKKLNENVQGSGLGLNICSIIAEKLNGEVKLDTSYNNGARFLFIL